MTTCNNVGPWLGASAEFCPNGCHRYSLQRRLALNPRGAHCVFVLLNPSTADAVKDDATVRRCVGFAKRWSCATVEIVNLYSLRSRDPNVLMTHLHEHRVGLGNHDALIRAAERADIIVAGWGGHPAALRHNRAGHAYSVIRQARANVQTARTFQDKKGTVRSELRPVQALALTAAGAPRHPLRLPYASQPKPFALPICEGLSEEHGDEWRPGLTA